MNDNSRKLITPLVKSTLRYFSILIQPVNWSTAVVLPPLLCPTRRYASEQTVLIVIIEELYIKHSTWSKRAALSLYSSAEVPISSQFLWEYRLVPTSKFGFQVLICENFI